MGSFGSIVTVKIGGHPIHIGSAVIKQLGDRESGSKIYEYDNKSI